MVFKQEKVDPLPFQDEAFDIVQMRTVPNVRECFVGLPHLPKIYII
jgi:hypothetical protein